MRRVRKRMEIMRRGLKIGLRKVRER